MGRVRVRRSFESEWLWYRINRFGGKLPLAGGVVVALLAAAAMFLDLGN